MQDTRPLIHTFWESLWQHLGSLIYSDPPPENHRLTIHPFGQLFYWLFVTNIITTSIHNSSLEIIVPTSQVASNTEYTYFYNHTTCSSKTDECVKYIKHAEGATVDLNCHWEGNSTHQPNLLQCIVIHGHFFAYPLTVQSHRGESFLARLLESCTAPDDEICTAFLKANSVMYPPSSFPFVLYFQLPSPSSASTSGTFYPTLPDPG